MSDLRFGGRLATLAGDLRASRRATLALGAAAAAAALAYVGLRDPGDPSTPMPRCPLHWATGLSCPACGGLRMTHALLHGDIGAAAASNPYLLVVLPILALLAGRAALRRRRGAPVPVIGRRTRWAILGSAVLWFAARNIAGW